MYIKKKRFITKNWIVHYMAEKSQDMPFANWRLRKTSGVEPFESEGPRIKGTN